MIIFAYALSAFGLILLCLYGFLVLVTGEWRLSKILLHKPPYMADAEEADRLRREMEEASRH